MTNSDGENRSMHGSIDHLSRRRWRVCGRVVSMIGMVGILLVADVVSAEPPAATSAKDRARPLYVEGQRLRKKGELKAALANYQKAYGIFPSPRILFNMAATAYRLRNWTASAEYYDRFVQNYPNWEKQEYFRDAADRLESLRKILSRVTIPCRDPDCDRLDAVISVDGRSYAKVMHVDAPIYLLPGTHKVELRLGGELRYGQKRRHHRAGDNSRMLYIGPEKVVVKRTGPTATELRQRARAKRWNVIGYTVLAAGGALALGAGAMYTWGGVTGNDAHTEYRDAAGNPHALAAHHKAVESAQTKMVVGHVLAGTAGVALAVAIYMIVKNPHAIERRRPAASRSISAALSPSTGGASLTLGGTF